MSKAAAPERTHCSNAAIRKAARRLGQLFDDVLEPSGIRATQHTLLAQIQHLNAPTIKELADALVMDLSALGHTLKPLARDGYVVMTSDPKDRRCKRVTLTPGGTAKLEASTTLWRSAHRRFEAAFGQKKTEKLRKALAILASAEFESAFLTATKVKRGSRSDDDATA